MWTQRVAMEARQMLRRAAAAEPARCKYCLESTSGGGICGDCLSVVRARRQPGRRELFAGADGAYREYVRFVDIAMMGGPDANLQSSWVAFMRLIQ